MASASPRFKIIQENRHSFKFITDRGITYRVVFFVTDAFFMGVKPETVLDVSFAPEIMQRSAFTEKISNTISFIIKRVVAQNKIVLFTCESIDNRQHARRKLFDKWFDKFSDAGFEKIDVVIRIDDKIEYYSSMLINSTMPGKDKIVTQFFQQASELSK